jgi:hypothetical protein
MCSSAFTVLVLKDRKSYGMDIPTLQSREFALGYTTEAVVTKRRDQGILSDALSDGL